MVLNYRVPLSTCTVPLCAGLDAPLSQYQVDQWGLTGMDLLQLTTQDLERMGVYKIGHQELILEAVEKLCSLVREGRSCLVPNSHRANVSVATKCVPLLAVNFRERRSVVAHGCENEPRADLTSSVSALEGCCRRRAEHAVLPGDHATITVL